MKVLALIESADHVCYRYRLNAFAWDLAEQDLYLSAMPLEKAWWRRLGQLVSVRRADIVILQRKLLPLWQIALLRRTARCLVYDLDDALFQRDSFARKGPYSRMRLNRFRATVRACDAVLVGNDYLRLYAAAYADPSQIHVVPTCVQPSWYPQAEHYRTDSARLVWIGQQSMLPSLHAIGEHLAEAAGELPDMQLNVICNVAPSLPGVRTELRPWSTATETTELADADIGISWLAEDSWSLGKCGLKVLQYMAAGLPVVANPVGVHKQMVIHGETGFLASTPAEWQEAITTLAKNPVLRAEMGAAGRRLVEDEYGVVSWGPRLARILKAVSCCSPSERRSTRKGAATLVQGDRQRV